jgi:2TM family of unknown function (DUF5676)
MRLDTRAFGLAAGAVAAVLFTLCALAIAIAPGATMAFFGYMMHLDLSRVPPALTLANFVGGLVCWTVGTALVFGLAAVIYNRLAGTGAAAQAAGRPQPATQHI